MLLISTVSYLYVHAYHMYVWLYVYLSAFFMHVFIGYKENGFLKYDGSQNAKIHLPVT